MGHADSASELDQIEVEKWLRDSPGRRPEHRQQLGLPFTLPEWNLVPAERALSHTMA